MAIMTLLAFEGMATATVMPVMARELDALAGYTWAFNAYLVASLFGMVAGGLWSDGAGPRGPIVAGVVAFCGGAVVAGVAPSLSVLVLGRGLQGVGGGVVIVSLYVLIARAYDVHLRPKAFSVLAAAWVVPSLVGPVIAGWLADEVTWRAVFWLVPVFVIPPALLLLPRLGAYQGGIVQPTTRARLMAGALATVGLLAIQDGSLRLSLAGAVEGAVGGAVLVLSVRNLLPAGTLTLRRGLPASVMMRGILAAAFFSAEVFIPLALIQTRGISTTAAGLTLAAAAALWSAGSYVQSRLPGDRDRSAAVRTGAVIVTACLVTLPLSLLSSLPPWVAGISWAVGAFGMGMAIPSVSVQVMRLSPDAEQGVNAAAIQIIDSVLVVVAIAAVGLGHSAAVASGGATAMTYVLLWLASAAIAVSALSLAGRMRPSLSP
jgi:MFS family permease